MKITKRDIEDVIEKLQSYVAEMEAHDIDTVKTSCNTYGMYYNFISFGHDGYLELVEDFNDLIDEDDE